MAEIDDLNVTDASNTARFPELQAPSTVNDGARALEGIIARWHKDTNGSIASTGSANAYVVAANQTLSAYYDGLEIWFDANFANTGSATLNVDAVSADTMKKLNDQNLESGDIEVGQKVGVVHDGTNWQVISPLANAVPAGGVDTAQIADNAVTLAKLEDGTQGDVLYYAASGAPTRLTAGTAGQFLKTNGAAADPAWAQAGGLIQTVNTLTGAVSSGTTAMPLDDTIPQNTEGNEFMTLAITPTDTNSKLEIEVVFCGSHSVAITVIAALFQDSTADAIAVCAEFVGAAGGLTHLKFTHHMTAGTTSATTFKVRVGAVSGTITFNGVGGARQFGGVMASSITIREIAS